MARPNLPPAPNGTPLDALDGTLDRVLFESEKTGWRVVQLRVAGHLEAVTAVGQLSGLSPGEPVRVSGRWVDNPKFGRQFQVESYVPVQPTSVEGIRRYLGSGLVDGIGSGLAERLVDHFGTKTLDVIEDAPHRLTEVEGIGQVRAASIQKAWQGARHLKEVMVFLQGHGVGTAHAMRIYRRFGNRAVQVVKSNPYQLALEVAGIGFRTADQLAKSLGLAPDDPARIEAGVLHALGQASDDGHVFLPRVELGERAAELLGAGEPGVQPAIDRLALQGHVIVEPHGVTLAALHRAETSAAKDLLRVLDGPQRAARFEVAQEVEDFEAQFELTLAPEQRDAIARALTAKALVITGGPGTGKTTIVKGIIAILEPKGTKIALGAPTGRAAKRMSEATGLEAKTLHRLLEYTPQDDAFARNADNPLDADLVIVDEASMIDTALMASLAEALPDRGHLVLVGDIDQLPSVGPGSVLGDVIGSGRVEVARLTRIFRQAEKSLIVTNAHRINAGEVPLLPEPGVRDADFYFIERQAPEDVLSTIEAVISKRLKDAFDLDPVDDVQVLTPMHRGPLGAERLNERLQALLNPKGPHVERGQQKLRVGDKVMQTKNDYDLGVFNGDLGRVQHVNPEDRVVVVEFDNKPVTYDSAALDQLVLAYACSIHKSQGSEYPAVVVPVSTQHFVMLHRNLLYTAVTRGKRLVVLVGSKRALSMAVRNVRDQTRHTWLGERLKAAKRLSGG